VAINRRIPELFLEALEARSRKSYWRRLNELQKSGSRGVFEAAAKALMSDAGKERALGADVMGELGHEFNEPPFKNESVPLLLELLDREADPSVKYAAIAALGRLRSREAVPKLVAFVTDSSDQVRLALARELNWCTWDSGEERPDPRVTATLIRLSSDRVAAIRDWATFSLAGSDEDTPEIRAALWGRVKDRHFDARMEAFRGLARRRESAALEPMRNAIQSIGPNRLGSWVVDDLAEFARLANDPALIELLAS
jgi:HEAT repeat protein